MKKTNKILTRALVILLALVLITSSVVSSTFAKYVVRKEAKTTVGLEAFGLKVELSGSGVNGETDKKNGESITYKVKNITLTPGDETYKNAITARVYGEANVAANVTMDVKVEYGGGEFVVSKNDFSGWTANKTYVPIAFTVGDSKATDSYNSLTADEATTAIKDKIKTVYTDFSGGTYKIAKGTKNIDETYNFGFIWEKNVGTGETQLLFDQVGTYLANQTTNKSTVTITYTISVEQDTTASN